MCQDDQAALVPTEATFSTLLNDLRTIISTGRGRATAAINAEMVQTYWHIGERLVREEQQGSTRADYGEEVLERIGRILAAEHGRGFSYRSIANMRQFYLTYQNLSALRTQLTWTHYRTLMRLEEGPRAFYERMAITGRWSSRELDRQINSMLYERAGLARSPEQILPTLLDPKRPLTYEDAFHDPYVLDFLGLEDLHSEKDLEAALVRHIEKFLLELGNDFAFMGRQKRLAIGDEDYYVDLLFFHRRLKAPVYIDLKMGKLTHADISQMRLYLKWAKRYDKQEGENDPIGLILCGSKNEQVIELLLADSEDSMDERIKVAQYLLLDAQPALKERLAHMSAIYEQEHTGEQAGDTEQRPKKSRIPRRRKSLRADEVRS